MVNFAFFFYYFFLVCSLPLYFLRAYNHNYFKYVFDKTSIMNSSIMRRLSNMQFNKLLTYPRFSFQPVNFRLFEYILYVLFNCLFAYGFLSHSNLLLIWTIHHFRWCGYKFKRILCHSLLLSYKDISEYLWHHALGNGTIPTYFDDLRPSRPGLERIPFSCTQP